MFYWREPNSLAIHTRQASPTAPALLAFAIRQAPRRNLSGLVVEEGQQFLVEIPAKLLVNHSSPSAFVFAIANVA